MTKKKVTKKTVIILVAGFTAIVIASVSAWFFLAKPYLDIRKLTFADDFHFDGKLRISGQDESSTLDMNFYVKGDMRTSQKNLSMNSRLAGTVDNIFIDSDIDAYFEPNYTYFKFNQFPTLMNAFGDAKELENRWARVEKTYDPLNLNDIIKKESLKRIENKGNETISGEKTKKYKISLSSVSLQEFVSFNDLSDVLTETERNDLTASLNNIETIEVVIWAGADARIRKIEGEIPLSFRNAGFKLEYSLTFNDFGKSDKLIAPLAYEKVEDIYGTLIK